MKVNTWFHKIDNYTVLCSQLQGKIVIIEERKPTERGTSFQFNIVLLIIMSPYFKSAFLDFVLAKTVECNFTKTR